MLHREDFPEELKLFYSGFGAAAQDFTQHSDRRLLCLD